jgi:hypothetical protein
VESPSSRSRACLRNDNRQRFALKRNVTYYGGDVRRDQTGCNVDCLAQRAVRIITAATRDGARLSLAGGTRTYALDLVTAGPGCRMHVGERKKSLRQKYRQRDEKKTLLSPEELHDSPIPRYTVALGVCEASTPSDRGRCFRV